MLLDVGGQDATEAFEDVGHSDEAREILDGMLVGPLKRAPGDPAPKIAATDKVSAGPWWIRQRDRNRCYAVCDHSVGWCTCFWCVQVYAESGDKVDGIDLE